MSFHKLVFLLSWFLFSGNMLVNAQQFFIPRITEHDGLSYNNPNCFFEDNQLVIWMGTPFGLNSFDGSEIKTFVIKNSVAKGASSINDIASSDTGHLWLATNAGLVLFNKSNSTFITFYNRSIADTLSANQINSMVANGNTIWLATNSGLMLFNIATQSYSFFQNQTHTDKMKIWDNRITKIFIDSKQRIWLGSFNGLWKFEKSDSKFISCDNSENDKIFDGLVMDVMEDHAHNIWFGSWNMGLKKWNEDGRISTFMDVPFAPTCAASICEQKNGDGTYIIWINKALTKFSPAANSFAPFLSQLGGGIAEDEVGKLFCNSQNQLWAGSNKGVFIYNEAAQYFTTKIISPASTITSQVPGIFIWQKKIFVTGQGASAFESFDPNMTADKNYSATINSPGFTPAVMNWLVDAKNHWWFSTSTGIVELDPSTNQKTMYQHNDTDSTSLPANFVNGIFQIENQTLVCPWRKGVWIFNEKQKIFSKYFNEQKNGLPYNVTKIIEDAQGNLWFADLDYGLFHYDVKNKKVIQILNGGRVANLYADGQFIWAATNDSLYRISNQTLQITSWQIPEAQKRYCYDFVSTPKSIWIATHNGLLLFNKTSNTFHVFDEACGLYNDDMGGSFAATHDTIYFVGNNYITRIYETQLNLNNKISVPLLLTFVAVSGNQITPEKNIFLKYNARNLEIYWALPSFDFPFHNKYFYRLDGVDETWKESGNTGQISYNSLAPGNYTFHYKAQTALGIELPEKNFLISVDPPFWNTWWFLILSATGFSCATYFIARNRINAIKRKAALEQSITEAEMKALRAQMNPHFIFNALNSIKGAMLGGDEFEAAKYLDKFSKLIRLVLENSRLKKISLQQELEYLNLYLGIESFRFSDFEYQINCPQEILSDEIMIQPMLIQPFIENALKHGLSHYEAHKKLSVDFYLKEDFIKVVVTDNGIGRHAAAEIQKENKHNHHSLGMNITEERLKLDSISKNRIEIIDLKDEKGNATGTQVIIYIQTK